MSSKKGDVYNYLPRLRLMAELKTCSSQSKPTARSRPDKPRDASTKKVHLHCTVLSLLSRTSSRTWHY